MTTTKETVDAPTNGAEARPAQPDNVVTALQAVMADLPAIGKDQHASREQGGYAYRGIEQITRHAQGLFAKYGVMFVPRVVGHEVVDITVNNKPWTDTRLLVEYTVYGPGGAADSITVGPILAIGRDNSDKGSNKCMTQAFKYALLQVLCIADAKDDADQGSPEADAGTRRTRERGDVEPAEGRPTSRGNTRRGPRVLEGWENYNEQKNAHDEFLTMSKSADEAQAEAMKVWRDERGDYEWPMPKERLGEYEVQLRIILGLCPSCGSVLTDENVYDAATASCGACAVM